MNSHIPANCDDIGLRIDQLRSIFRNAIKVLPKCAVIDNEVLVLNEAVPSQFIEKRNGKLFRRRIARIARKGK